MNEGKKESLARDARTSDGARKRGTPSTALLILVQLGFQSLLLHKVCLLGSEHYVEEVLKNLLMASGNMVYAIPNNVALSLAATIYRE